MTVAVPERHGEVSGALNEGDLHNGQKHHNIYHQYLRLLPDGQKVPWRQRHDVRRSQSRRTPSSPGRSTARQRCYDGTGYYRY